MTASAPLDQPPFGEGLVSREIVVPRHEVAFVRYLLEAEDGLGLLYGDGERLWVIAPAEQLARLERWLDDLGMERA